MTKRRRQGLFLGAGMLLLLWRSAAAGEAVRQGLALCVRWVIPALFPFFVVSGLFVAMGFARSMGRRMAPVTRRLFGVAGAGASAFVLGLLGGYPVGGRTVGQLYREGQIGKEEAEHLLAFCNNAGPSFILGVVGLGCFHSLRAGVALYLIHGACAVAVGILLRAGAGRTPGGSGRPDKLPEKLLPVFVDCVQEACGAMLRLCGFVVFAMVLQAVLTDLTGLRHPVLLGFIELTGGIAGLKNTRADFVWAAVLLGWGGLSVHGQTAAVLAETELKLGRYFVGKLLQAALSGVAAYFIAGGAVH